MIPTSRLENIVEQYERGIGDDDDERAELARDLLATRRLLTRVNQMVGTVVFEDESIFKDGEVPGEGP